MGELRLWELRYGDHSDLIIININTVVGIATVGQFRDWLYSVSAVIQKEWWEQNDYYVFRTNPGNVTFYMMKTTWGPPYIIIDEPDPEKPTCETIGTTGTITPFDSV